jgi:hypothetical protein
MLTFDYQIVNFIIIINKCKSIIYDLIANLFYMKHNPLCYFLPILTAAATPSMAFQEFPKQHPQASFSTGLSAAGTSHEEGKPFKSNVALNDINIHAFRHFMRNFPAATDEYWLKTNTGYIVKFKTDVILHEVYYKLNGGFQYSVRYYEEKNLDEVLTARIKNQYSGYSIGVITEITESDRLVYLIKITNPHSIKTIQFSDGKLELIDDLENLSS